jgi:hypothetical protein
MASITGAGQTRAFRVVQASQNRVAGHAHYDLRERAVSLAEGFESRVPTTFGPKREETKEDGESYT